VPLHPVQLYEALLDLVLAVGLHRGLGRCAAGGAFWRYLAGYSLIRLSMGRLRGDSPSAGFLDPVHVLSLLTLALSAAALLRRPRAAAENPAERP